MAGSLVKKRGGCWPSHDDYVFCPVSFLHMLNMMISDHAHCFTLSALHWALGGHWHFVDFTLDTKYPPYEGRDLLDLSPSHLHFIPMRFIFPCCLKTANLCCHTPSKHLKASSASSVASLIPSIIWIPILFIPHWAKCLPSGVDSSLTSTPWPTCLTCMCCVVLPTYCFPHRSQVIR